MLSITGLSKTYAGGVRALDGIDLDIPKGLFGLLGPNGAGKSTLMRTIATLQEANTGTIRFDGIDVSEDKIALQRRLGYLPQDFGTYPRISAQDMLRHFAALKGIHGAHNRAIVDRMLARTNLWEARSRSVDTFSGGMRQRFGIAQALLGDPDLLIVDEPTAGLDPAERRRFQNLLSEVGEDVVVILSTHIVEDIAALCPQVAIMAGGRILASGDPRVLSASLQGRLWTGIASGPLAAAPDGTRQILFSRRFAGSTELRLVSENPPPGFAAAIPSLEDVYFKTLIDHGIDIQAE